MNVVVYAGNSESRRICREYEFYVENNPKKTQFNALITTYEIVMKDSIRSLHFHFFFPTSHICTDSMQLILTMGILEPHV